VVQPFPFAHLSWVVCGSCGEQLWLIYYCCSMVRMVNVMAVMVWGLVLSDGVRDVFWIFTSKKQEFCLLCRNICVSDCGRKRLGIAEDVLI